MKKNILFAIVSVMVPAVLYLATAQAIERGRGALNAPFDHTISYNGAMHKPGLLKPYYVNPRSVGEGTGIDPEAEGTSGGCVVCHGEASGYADLTGGVTENGLTPPSCYSCHNQNWLEVPRTPVSEFTFSSPPSHVETRRGRPHREDHARPNSGLPDFEGNQNYGMCVICHGADLTGGVPWTNKTGVTTTPPSCYTCHGKRWAIDPVQPAEFNPPPSHYPENGGDNIRGIFHRAGHDNPAEGLPNFEGTGNFGMCVACHGNDLTGGVAWTNRDGVTTKPPSCFTCHVKRWAGEVAPVVFNPTSDHTVSRRGRMHRPLPGDVNPGDPLNPWQGSPFPGTFADAGYGYCAVCHSSGNGSRNLEGGPVNSLTGKKPPSCYTCHIERWDGGPTGDLSANFCTGGARMCGRGHSVNMRGRIHKPDLYAPVTCATSTCHGADLRGSGGRPSCYTCHGAEWNK